MKKKIVLSLLIVLTVLSLFSCDEVGVITDARDNNESEKTLFERHAFNDWYSILVDRETGVCYFEYRAGHHYGLTVMLNSDGTPKIWKEEEK